MYLRIRYLRENVNKPQREIAKYLGISQRGYSHYENGNNFIPLEYLIKLAYFYNTSTDYILGVTNEKEPYPRARLMQKKIKQKTG